MVVNFGSWRTNLSLTHIAEVLGYHQNQVICLLQHLGFSILAYVFGVRSVLAVLSDRTRESLISVTTMEAIAANAVFLIW